jgi:hypothetical protein
MASAAMHWSSAVALGAEGSGEYHPYAPENYDRRATERKSEPWDLSAAMQQRSRTAQSPRVNWVLDGTPGSSLVKLY